MCVCVCARVRICCVHANINKKRLLQSFSFFYADSLVLRSKSGRERDGMRVDNPSSSPLSAPPSQIPKRSKFAVRGFILS